ncbi:MAG: LysR family transcriptional regulator [Chloroflexi bacterium]|nr:LysR family transcriptional regulator [Chloroflexota bacterium]
MLSLNAHQFNVFLAAAETLSFTQAARRLQITQPGVSRIIQGMEDHFGLPLFVRCGRSLQLTEAGKALVPLAQDVVNLSTLIEETMESIRGEVQGNLIIGCCAPSGRYLLPRLLAGFHNACPQVKANCRVLSQAEVLEALVNGSIHIAVICQAVKSPDLVFIPIADEEIVLIVPRNHPWASREAVDFQELTREKFILPGQDTDLYEMLSDELSRQGFSIAQLNPIMNLGSLEGIALTVLEGSGIAFIPRLLMSRLVPDFVVPVPVRDLDIRRTVYAGRCLSTPFSSARQAFWNYLRDHGRLADCQEGPAAPPTSRPSDKPVKVAS